MFTESFGTSLVESGVAVCNGKQRTLWQSFQTFTT